MRENLESLELSKNRVEMIEYAAKLPVFLKNARAASQNQLSKFRQKSSSLYEQLADYAE